MEPWYALHVRSQYERKVREALARQGTEAYLPVYTERSRWSDRTKTIERPLFPGYLFARADWGNRAAILGLAGVVRIVGAVSEAELDQVRQVVDSGLPVAPCSYLTAGQKVKVIDGALAGVEGVVSRMKGRLRVIVSIELLRRSVAVELDTEALRAA